MTTRKSFLGTGWGFPVTFTKLPQSTVRVVSEDPGQRRLQIAEGDRTATLNVVPFSDDVAQLLIAGHAGPGEGPTASLVVQAVLRICKEMGKHCEVGGG